MELMCMKRYFMIGFYTRLPVGHTHEDIDGKQLEVCM
jgi:hypothetical protein